MKKNYLFYKTNVDISSPKSMWCFLHDHYTYWTMNSWNGLKTIANNVKLYKLGLEGDWQFVYNYLYKDANSYWPSEIQDLLDEFEFNHPGYEIRTNGRSGGYILLMNKSNNQNVLPEFITNYETYEDFKYDFHVKEFKYDLQEYTELVRDFDRLCDDIRDVCNTISLTDQESYMVDLVSQGISEFTNWAFEEVNKLGCYVQLKESTKEEDKHKVVIDVSKIKDYYALQDCLRYFLKKYLPVDDYDIEEYLYGEWKIVKK